MSDNSQSSLKAALVQRLTDNLEIQAQLLQTEISIDGVTQNLEIRSPNEIVIEFLFRNIRAIAPSAFKMGCPNINLYLGQKPMYPCPTFMFLGCIVQIENGNGQKQMGGIPLMTSEEIQAWVNRNPNLNIVRMSDNVGIFAGSYVQRSSGLTQLEWQGRSMDEPIVGGKRTCPPEEFSRFLSRLFAEIRLQDFIYEAYLYTGERCRFRVNASLILCPELGGLLRAVEILEVTPLGRD